MLFTYFKLARFLVDKIKLNKTEKSPIKNKIQVRKEYGEPVRLPIMPLFVQERHILG